MFAIIIIIIIIIIVVVVVVVVVIITITIIMCIITIIIIMKKKKKKNRSARGLFAVSITIINNAKIDKSFVISNTVFYGAEPPLKLGALLSL